MLNKVILIGRLGKDPEVRYTPDGVQVCNFSIATDETWKDKNGQKQQRTEWHNLVTYGKLAEICAEYLKKGSQVYVEGKINTQKWQDRQGVDRYTTKITVNMLKMLGSPGQKEQIEEFPQRQDDDDIPF